LAVVDAGGTEVSRADAVGALGRYVELGEFVDVAGREASLQGEAGPAGRFAPAGLLGEFGEWDAAAEVVDRGLELHRERAGAV
jgi:hypothetical protein